MIITSQNLVRNGQVITPVFYSEDEINHLGFIEPYPIKSISISIPSQIEDTIGVEVPVDNLYEVYPSMYKIMNEKLDLSYEIRRGKNDIPVLFTSEDVIFYNGTTVLVKSYRKISEDMVKEIIKRAKEKYTVYMTGE